jgi:hypothetical protein
VVKSYEQIRPTKVTITTRGEPLWLSGKVVKNEKINEIKRTQVRSPPRATSLKKTITTRIRTHLFSSGVINIYFVKFSQSTITYTSSLFCILIIKLLGTKRTKVDRFYIDIEKSSVAG